MALALAVSLSAVVLATSDRKVEARQRPALPPAGKPVIPYLLSDRKTVAALEKEFGLNGDKKRELLLAVRRENRAIAGAYARSERVLGAGRNSMARSGDAVVVSAYNRRVSRAEERARAEILGLVPARERPALRSWLGSRWNQAVRQNCGGYTRLTYNTRSSLGVTDRVYATQYNGYTNFEVALPHRALKQKGGFRVRLSYGGRSVWVRVKEVGPWNTRDNYWQSSRYRTMWRNLPRGVPEAKAAYCRNYNQGEDEFGRTVANPAGIDITPAVAHRLGLATYENARITVYYPWVGH
ncbi:hypothetical protein [Rubrobacter naiadicus]|uniref:hypothetical protein n=1 Tax=Rubrobacter naiadicus TaxID=1392641 RepID=UPI00235EBDB9|nr:hypothetical protein [Rubrobacter naiadicus]